MFEPSWESARGVQKDVVVGTSAPLCDHIKTEQGTELERWTYQYFQEETIPVVGEWTFTSDFQDFENSVIQQFARSVPVIRHLAVALASRHKDTMSLSTQQSQFASSEYLKALNKINHAGGETSIDTVLLCCLLIASYEHFDPYGASSGGLPHHAAAVRIFKDSATIWSPTTKVIYFKAQQIEMIISILDTPIFLPGAVSNSDIQQSIPSLPTAFSSPTEMQRKFFDIFRWRFLCSLVFPIWDRHCSGFVQVLDLFSCWYTQVCDYITRLKAQQRTGDDLQLATTMSIQYRMVYTALWHSVHEGGSKHHHPGHANLVDLSSRDKVTIHIPTKSGPSSPDVEVPFWRSKGQKQVGIWPAVKSIDSCDRPPYVTITLYAHSGVQEHAERLLEHGPG
ncbi:hypothetical protein H2200_006676 [Cladophialophora chaetospira]|uniref:Uncharacterized protein n=1 Tax=Cladophialophora chaetospira TaxID=386627 RepID=A0AA38X8S9_9EURO|nr:hypothetical protein H2200_006676 [Cladophialophora chaetospira]